MSEVVFHWAGAMLQTCLCSGLIALLVYVACRSLPRLPPAVRAWLWWLVSVRFLIGLCFTIPLRLPDSTLPTSTMGLPRMPSLAGPIPALPHNMPPVSAGPLVIALLTSTERLVIMLLFAVWVIGAMGQVLLLLKQIGMVRRLLHHSEDLAETTTGATTRRLAARIGLSRPPRIAASDMVTGPLTSHPFRPIIVLPVALVESLSEQEIEMIIAHEMAHIHRADLLLALPLCLGEIVFWFFPPFRCCCRAWDTARELACDAFALDTVRTTPAGYGALLLKVIEADICPNHLPALGVATSFHTLRERLKRLEEAERDTRPALAWRMLPIVLMLLLVLPWRVAAGGGKGEEKGNLVINGGFEAGGESPDGWFYGSMFGVPQVQVARDTQQHHAGKASLRFVKTASTFAPVALLSQTLPDNPAGAKHLRIGVWVKADNVRKATLAVHFQKANGETSKIEWGAYIGENTPGGTPVTHNWRRYEKTLTLPPETRTVSLSLQMYGSGTVWMDDVFARYE